MLGFPPAGCDPQLSISPLWVPPWGCFGGPGAAERDRRRYRRGGERGEAMPVIWHQEMAKKCKLKKIIKKETKHSSTFGSCFGVSSLTASQCPRGLVWCERQMSPRCRGHGSWCVPFWERGSGGCPLGVRGIFGGVPVGPFSRVTPAAGRAGSCRRQREAAGGRSTGAREKCLDASRPRFGGGGEGVRPARVGRASSWACGAEGPGTDPFIKVTAVGSTKQRRCDYFGELRELHWPDSHK